MKKKKIETAAQRYLAGDSLLEISNSMDMANSNLHKILTKTAGDSWFVNFTVKKFRIDETIEFKIPRLLSEETMQKIRDRLEANKTYRHGEIKNKYLLKRLVFCGQCGFALMGQTSTNKPGGLEYKYYRTQTARCGHNFFVPAGKLEDQVTEQLFSIDEAGLDRIFFKSPTAVENVV